MGAAVLNGGVTTLLATCGLAFSSSGIMQNMFKMLVCTVVFGILQALWLQPVIFSTFDWVSCGASQDPVGANGPILPVLQTVTVAQEAAKPAGTTVLTK